MSLYSELKQLCALPGVSGREGCVRDFIKEKISPLVDSVRGDVMGNLIALKKGKSGEKRIMLCAHMDEIGLLVNFIEDSGYIRVAALGGVDLGALAYGKVVSENGTLGVIVPEAKAKLDELKTDNMYIDIGASSKREAERRVRIGDFFVAAPELYRLAGKRIAGRPLDDRVGCLVLLELARRLSATELENDVYFVFSVQEEVGCRGSVTATYGIEPTEAICFDVTLTGDTVGATPMACALGKGVAVKIKDNSVICHELVVNTLIDIAKKEKIAFQREILTAGGTDTCSMQLTAGGAMAGALSIPTRNVHTSVEVCDMGDIEACIDLSEKYILARG